MSVAGGPEGHDLVVADDGSIPAQQLRRLGVRPGAHLRVVAGQPTDTEGNSLVGRLASWPDVTWEDFERGSRLAQVDLDRL